MKKWEIGDIKIIEAKYDTVFVSRRSIIDGRPYTMAIGNVMAEQVYNWYVKRFKGLGTLIQEEFPNLLPAEREFLLSGITPGEWDRHMKSDEEPDETIKEAE